MNNKVWNSDGTSRRQMEFQEFKNILNSLTILNQMVQISCENRRRIFYDPINLDFLSQLAMANGMR